MKRLAQISIALLIIAAVIVSAYSCSKAPKATSTSPPVMTSTSPPVVTPASPPVIAHIKIQSGTAGYRSGSSGSFAPIVNNTGVSVGDQVRSEAGSQVSVEFLDGSSLVLLANTEIEVQNYVFTRQGDSIVTRVARIAVINGDVSGDVRQDLVYPPSVFEIVSSGEIYTIKGTLIQ